MFKAGLISIPGQQIISPTGDAADATWSNVSGAKVIAVDFYKDK